MSEYYAVERSGSSLQHYGVKGMKWGVRRYQRPDGTLTDKGKARIVKSGWYLNPSKKGKDRKHTDNRKAVSDQFVREYNERVKPLSDAGKSVKGVDEEVWNRYKDRYASAVLKDLKLKDTKKARKAVQAVFNDTDPDYKYDNPDSWSDRKRKTYYDRWEKMQHPTREKIKKHVKTLKEGLSVASNIKNLIRK